MDVSLSTGTRTCTHTLTHILRVHGPLGKNSQILGGGTRFGTNARAERLQVALRSKAPGLAAVGAGSGLAPLQGLYLSTYRSSRGLTTNPALGLGRDSREAEQLRPLLSNTQPQVCFGTGGEGGKGLKYRCDVQVPAKYFHHPELIHASQQPPGKLGTTVPLSWTRIMRFRGCRRSSRH